MRDKRKAELARRRKVKAELLEKCPVDTQGKKLCPKCGKLPDPIRGLQLSHKVSLARGGKTRLANCEILCASCHGAEHRTEGVAHGKPIDRPMEMSGFHGLRAFPKHKQVGRKE